MSAGEYREVGAYREVNGTAENDTIELIQMVNDPDPVPPGTRGKVTFVDDAWTVHVQWEDGRTLGLIAGQDRWKVIDKAPF